MKLINKFDRYITAVFIATIFAIVATSYYTFKSVIVTYNKQQQEATIPLFSWISTEVINPLTLSKFMAKDPLLVELVEQPELDREKLYRFLNVYSLDDSLLSFIALEKHQVLLDSNGKALDFNHQDTEWYQRIKQLDRDYTADIGDADNPTLFFDVKMYNFDKEFIGFTGVGVDLDIFREKLTTFKNQFGFEVYFVDNNDQITLSTDGLMITESHHRRDQVVNINSMPWYEQYQQSLANDSNEFSVSGESETLTVTHLDIEELNWRVFVIAPSATSQQTFWMILLSRFGVFILVAMVLYLAFFSVMELFKKDIVADANIDHLTGLPNRAFVELQFNKLIKRHSSFAIVVGDIDHFKIINDTHGHIIGDNILKRIAKLLNADLRSKDMTARWGGEEFLMILPDTELSEAYEICERLRANIEASMFYGKDKTQPIEVTMSFGISVEQTSNVTYKRLIANADQALYQAKENGRNRVENFKKIA